MKKTIFAVIAITSTVFAAPALADGHHHRHEYKDKYWDGDCEVKREYKKNGDFKEVRKCRAPEREVVYVREAPVREVVVVEKAPAREVVVVEPRPVEVVFEAPSVVVNPPRIVVR